MMFRCNDLYELPQFSSANTLARTPVFNFDHVASFRTHLRTVNYKIFTSILCWRRKLHLKSQSIKGGRKNSFKISPLDFVKC